MGNMEGRVGDPIVSPGDVRLQGLWGRGQAASMKVAKSSLLPQTDPSVHAAKAMCN